MNDRTNDPMVYFTRDNGKLGLCLSHAGKWIMGIITTLITTGAIAIFALVWESATYSREALTEIRLLSKEVERIDGAANARLDRYEERLLDVERQIYTKRA